MDKKKKFKIIVVGIGCAGNAMINLLRKEKIASGVHKQSNLTKMPTQLEL
jgi:cell division GTPase FtsZ